MSTVSEITERNHRRAVHFFWTWLVLTTLVSLAGNVAHAWLTAEPDTRYLATCVAAVPPVVLLLSVHGLAVLAKATASGAVYRASVAATGVLAVGAFVLSFVALRDLALRAGIPSSLAPVLPLVIDLAIGVATLALVAVGDKPARRGRTATRGAFAAASPNATNATPSRGRKTVAAEGGDRDSAIAFETETATPGAGDRIRQLAAELVAEKVTRQSVDTVEAILTAHEQGDPLNRIAKKVDVHHSAVARIVHAAAAHGEPTLVVV